MLRLVSALMLDSFPCLTLCLCPIGQAFCPHLGGLSLVKRSKQASSDCGQLTSQIEIWFSGHALEERNELFSINLCSRWRKTGSLPTVLAGEWLGCRALYVCVGLRWSYNPLWLFRRDPNCQTYCINEKTSIIRPWDLSSFLDLVISLLLSW